MSQRRLHLADALNKCGKRSGLKRGLVIGPGQPTIQRVLRQVRDADLLTVTPERGGVVQLRLHLDALLAQPLTGVGRRRFAAPEGTRP